MFFDNDGFEEITPSFEQEASDNNTSDNDVVETAEPQPTAGNEQALHNKKFAQRRIDDRNRRLAEQARLQEIQALKAEVDALKAKVASPKEEDSTDFLEKLAESPESVLNEFLEKKLAQYQQVDPDSLNHYVNTKFIGPVYDSPELSHNMAILSEIEEIAQVDPVVGEFFTDIQKFHFNAEQEFVKYVNDVTKNGRILNPVVEAEIQRESVHFAKELAKQQQQLIFENPSYAPILNYIVDNYVPKSEAPKTELPKNTRQLREDAIAPSNAPFKRINTFYR